MSSESHLPTRPAPISTISHDSSPQEQASSVSKAQQQQQQQQLCTRAPTSSLVLGRWKPKRCGDAHEAEAVAQKDVYRTSGAVSPHARSQMSVLVESVVRVLPGVSQLKRVRIVCVCACVCVCTCMASVSCVSTV